MSNIPITPQTRVGEFLQAYPELEALLISLSPAFEKLRNPVLRRTIGRVATLQQVAVVGNVPLEIIINKLRQAAGQSNLEENMTNEAFNTQAPAWFSPQSIIKTLDARPMLAAGEHPLADVLSQTAELGTGQIYELITPFMPMPLIQKVKDRGFEAYTDATNESEVHTYFIKA